MTCKKLRAKARWEQDRWLGYLSVKGGPNIYENTIIRRLPIEQERMEFLRWDSHGSKASPISKDNIIRAGKHAAGVFDTEKGATNSKVGGGGWVPYADELKEILLAPYEKWAWPGGLAILEDYLRRVCGLGPLRKQFGDEIVRGWLAAFLFYAFGWPDLVIRERYAGLHSR